MAGWARRTSGAMVSALLLVVLAGCSSASPASSSGAASSAVAAPADAASIAPAVTSGDASRSTAPGGGTGTNYCSLFTTDEVGALVGAPVAVGDVSDLYGAGCRWVTADGKGVVLVEVEQPAGLVNDYVSQPQQRAVTGVGDQALVGPSGAGGTQAAATDTAADNFYYVRVDPSPSDNAVIGLLKELMTRSHE